MSATVDVWYASIQVDMMYEYKQFFSISLSSDLTVGRRLLTWIINVFTHNTAQRLRYADTINCSFKAERGFKSVKCPADKDCVNREMVICSCK